MMQQKTYHWIIFAVCWVTSAAAMVPFNFFEPYDVLVKPQRFPWFSTQFLFGYEGMFRAHGFMGDDDCGNATVAESKGNVLQLWQKTQNALAAFQGSAPGSTMSDQLQFFNLDGDNQTHGIFTPCGSLRASNFMFGARFRIPYNITLAAYIPYRIAQLKDVQWIEQRSSVLFEDVISPDLISTIEQIGGLNLRGWKRHGPGDLMLQAEYYFHRFQAKPYLKNVGIELRLGLSIPTGLKEDVDRLIAFPFGYDAGVGILAAGRLELWFIHHLRLAVDVQLMHLFGNTRERRIKTNSEQTDLFLLNKACVFKDPGLLQHFTIWGDLFELWNSFSARVAYQFTKQNESKYFACTDGLDPNIFNDAESLQDWTAHSLIFDFSYTWHRQHVDPKLSAFVKYGFNGKRAIAGDTAGFIFSIAF